MKTGKNFTLSGHDEKLDHDQSESRNVIGSFDGLDRAFDSYDFSGVA